MRLRREWLLAVAVATGALAACNEGPAFSVASTSAPIEGRACPPDSALTYQSFGEPFFESWCTGCHSSQNTSDARRMAPVGVDFDTLAGIRKWLPTIYAYAADDNKKMPAVGGPSDTDRHLLGDWLACGAPGTDPGFTVTASDAGGGPPLPSGACAKPFQPLPATILPRCTAQTRACMMSCTDQNTCPGNCLAADTTPPDPTTGIDCKGCYYDQALACADPQCRVPTAEYLCCITSKCASGDQTCIDQQCSVENETFALCLYYAASSCLDGTNALTSECFGAAAASALDGGAD